MARLALPFIVLFFAIPAQALPERYKLLVTGAVSLIDRAPVANPLGHLIGMPVTAAFRYDANEATPGVPYSPAPPSEFELTSPFLSYTASNASSSGFPVWPSEDDLEVRFEDNGFDEIRVLAISPLTTGIFDARDELTGAILVLTSSDGSAYTGIPRSNSLTLGDFDAATLILFGTEHQEFLGPYSFEDNWVLRVELASLSLMAIPEPLPFALLGLAGLAIARRRLA